MLGQRGAPTANAFMQDVASRVSTRIQLTTDGHRVYADAVEDAFGAEIDYAMLVKLYGSSGDNPEARYSPATCIGCRTGVLSGSPDPKHISTSYVERQNLSMRMGMRRFTRLTNGFSKKFENHGHQVALYFMHYNYCRVHSNFARYSGDGIWPNRSRLDAGGTVRLAPGEKAECKRRQRAGFESSTEIKALQRLGIYGKTNQVSFLFLILTQACSTWGSAV